jgi:hypothetical protein
VKIGFGYVIIVIIAGAVAAEYFRPMGQYVHDVFQTLVDAFSGRK